MAELKEHENFCNCKRYWKAPGVNEIHELHSYSECLEDIADEILRPFYHFAMILEDVVQNSNNGRVGEISPTHVSNVINALYEHAESKAHSKFDDFRKCGLNIKLYRASFSSGDPTGSLLGAGY